MALKFKVILIISIIAVLCFFGFLYTQGAMKKAENKYNVMKTELEGRNDLLEKEIAVLNENKIRIEGQLKLEKEITAKLENDLTETKRLLATVPAKVEKMPDSDVVKNTRGYLTQYIQKNPQDGKTQLTGNDLFQTKTNVNWSFLSMKANLGILTEHNVFKTELIPTLEEKSKSLEKERDSYSDLYREEQSISRKRTEQYTNEKKLRIASEDLYATYKKQLKAGKTKAFLMGGGIGAGLVLLFALLK